MALVKTIKCKNGATVRIFDDDISKDPEENARRWAKVWEVADRIAENHRDELVAMGILKRTKAQIAYLEGEVKAGRMTLEEALKQ